MSNSLKLWDFVNLFAHDKWSTRRQILKSKVVLANMESGNTMTLSWMLEYPFESFAQQNFSAPSPDSQNVVLCKYQKSKNRFRLYNRIKFSNPSNYPFSPFMLVANHKIVHVTPLRRIFWHGKTFNDTTNEFLSQKQLRSNHNLYCRFYSSVWKLIFHLYTPLDARGPWINLYRFAYRKGFAADNDSPS